MPFQSEKQRRYLWANEPEIARDWTDTYGSRIEKNDGGITNPRLIPHTGADLLAKKNSEGTRSKYQPPGGGDKGMKGKGDSYGDSYGPGRTVAGPVKGAIDEFKAPAHIERELRDLAKRTAEDKREQKVEVFRSRKKKNLLDHLPYIGTLKKMFNHRDFFIDQVLNKGHYGKLTEEEFYGLSPVQQEEKLKEYNRARGMGEIDAYGRKVDLSNRGEGQARELRKLASAGQGGGGGGGGTTPPVEEESEFQASLTGTADTPDYYVGNNPLASNIAWGKQAGVDPRTMGVYNQDQLGFPTWAAEGGRIPAAFGGIMDSSTGRRAYGLGSIFKKIGRAAKKVFKSPIGKAALLYAGGSFLGGLPAFGGSGMGWGSAANLFKPGGWSQGNILNSLIRKKNLDAAGKFKDWGGANLWKAGILGAGALPFFMGGEEEDEGSKFDYEGAKNKYADEMMRIKRGAMAGTLDPNEFNYLGVKDGGRIGLYAGGQSTPSDYTIEDAMMTTTQDKLGGITDVMKQADLNRQGSVGQFYAENGGPAKIGADNVSDLLARVQELQDEGLDFNAAMVQAMKELSKGKAQGGRIGAEEGGLMDLGGMEKDYRNDGGFVPLGGEEKADDVPARLSKNEFVFTADAVRGAGGGDIDKGAEIMENIMKNLEQGGQISEETQGLSGAQEMFGVSERLSEVV